MKSLVTHGTNRERPVEIVIPSHPPSGDADADPGAFPPDGAVVNREGGIECCAASTEPLIEIESIVFEKPIQPRMAWYTGVVKGNAVHFDFVRATCSRAAFRRRGPTLPAVHKPLRIGPGALVEANLVYICGQPLRAPAQCSLLNLHSQKREQHQAYNEHTYQADNPYSPLSRSYIELDQGE